MAKCSLGQSFEEDALKGIPLDVPEKIREIAWDLGIPWDVLFKWSVGDFWGGEGARTDLLDWWMKMGRVGHHNPQVIDVMVVFHEAVAEGARRRRLQLPWSRRNLPKMLWWYVRELRMRACAQKYRDPPQLRYG